MLQNQNDELILIVNKTKKKKHEKRNTKRNVLYLPVFLKFKLVVTLEKK